MFPYEAFSLPLCVIILGVWVGPMHVSHILKYRRVHSLDGVPLLVRPIPFALDRLLQIAAASNWHVLGVWMGVTVI